MTFRTSTAAALTLALTLGGCVSAQGNLSPDYGLSVKQNIAAQVADPDARYRRDAPPASSGPRTAVTQKRYDRGEVLVPVTAGASSIGLAGGGAAAPAGK